jgi:formate hydrogenlyase subunit 3/multisubunit Na+/H+ antiporter MnhD subunit
MALGLATAFTAALLGVLTTAPRAVLGYSSASQMGLVLVAAGAGLADSNAASLAAAAIVAFSLHHGLAKSALVLGDDAVSRSTGRMRTAALAGLALPALALVGVPLTSGFVAKYALKDALHAMSGAVPHSVETLLPWTAVGTAALMLRFFALTRRQAPAADHARPLWLPAALWAVLLVLVAFTCWLWPAEWSAHALASALSPASMWAALWPGLVAVVLALLLGRVPRFTSADGLVPPGDWLGPATRGISSLFGRETESADAPGSDTHGTTALAAIGRTAVTGERMLVAWTVAAAVFVTLAVLLVGIATR